MQPNIEDLTRAFVDGYPELTSDDQHLAVAIYRLLAKGRAAEPVAIAEAAGWAPSAVEDRLDSWGAVFRDRRGAVVGLWGFAMEELTGHFMDLGEAGRGWGWCAYDTLFIPDLLGVDAAVSSPCRSTGRQVRLRVSRAGVVELDPAGAAVSMLTPDGPIDDDVRQSLCHFIHFFVSRAAAEEWIGAHPGVSQVSVHDAFEIGRRQNAALYPAVVGAAAGKE